ncbi:MAG: tRNA lysidine(34) synthetase TilS [Arcanobacterium sp.]|nr:tRNA lysidine(34) synthetase TilS [Arcanobacterium sp.]
MAGPHRDVSVARNLLRESFAQLPSGQPVVLAVSGGADSLALAASAKYAARFSGTQLYALVVDHQLRPESADEANDAVVVLTQLGISAHIAKVVLTKGEGPEGDARRARYAALAEFAESVRTESGPGVVYLGHNADDQAETVLLGLGRGSGPRSLAGMAEKGLLPLHSHIEFRRPLLSLRHEQLINICSELGLKYVDDPSNFLDGPWRTESGEPLRRSRIRHELLPLLNQILDDGVVPALGRTATIFRADDDALSEIARERISQYVSVVNLQGVRKKLFTDLNLLDISTLEIDCRALADEHRAIRTRILRDCYEKIGGAGSELVFWHLDALDKLITSRDNGQQLDLPGITARRTENILQLTISNPNGGRNGTQGRRN